MQGLVRRMAVQTLSQLLTFGLCASSTQPVQRQQAHRSASTLREATPLRELRALGGKEFEFIQSTRPIFAEETGKRAVCQQLASGLASGTVIRFVGGIPDTLDFGAAARTGLFVAAVDGHAFAKCGDVFGEFAGGLGAQALDPKGERCANGGEEALDFRNREFLGERERGKFRFE